MKAVSIESPGEMKDATLPVPSPGPGEVLLRVTVIGYCGSDLNTFRGLNPLVTYPRIPGHEIGAVIESCGIDVPAKWQPSMVVTCLPYTSCGTCAACLMRRFNACQFNQTLGVQREGALTEFIVVDWRKLFHSPGLTASECALIEPLAVGFHAVRRADVTTSDTVLVFGAGMIGLGAISSAGLARNATVIAVDIDDRKLALAARAGASFTINSRKEELHQRVMEYTHGRGADVVIEAVGRAETFLAAVDEVSYAGRVVYIGYAKDPICFETKLFIVKELDIRGSRGSAPEDFDEVIKVLNSGRYPVKETITQCVSLEHAAAAMKSWDHDPGAVTKIHIQVASSGKGAVESGS